MRPSSGMRCGSPPGLRPFTAVSGGLLMASSPDPWVGKEAMGNVSRLRSTSAARAKRASGWTFLTNHAVVLLLVDAEPDQRVADLASRAGLTQRAVQMIL